MGVVAGPQPVRSRSVLHGSLPKRRAPQAPAAPSSSASPPAANPAVISRSSSRVPTCEPELLVHLVEPLGVGGRERAAAGDARDLAHRLAGRAAPAAARRGSRSRPRRCPAPRCRRAPAPARASRATSTGSRPVVVSPSESSTMAAGGRSRCPRARRAARAPARARRRWRCPPSAAEVLASAPPPSSGPSPGRIDRVRCRRRRPRRPRAPRPATSSRKSSAALRAASSRVGSTSSACIEPDTSVTSMHRRPLDRDRHGGLRPREGHGQRGQRGREQRGGQVAPPGGHRCPRSPRSVRRAGEAHRVAARAAAREHVGGQRAAARPAARQEQRAWKLTCAVLPSAPAAARPRSRSQGASVDSTTWSTPGAAQVGAHCLALARARRPRSARAGARSRVSTSTCAPGLGVAPARRPDVGQRRLARVAHLDGRHRVAGGRARAAAGRARPGRGSRTPPPPGPGSRAIARRAARGARSRLVRGRRGRRAPRPRAEHPLDARRRRRARRAAAAAARARRRRSRSATRPPRRVASRPSTRTAPSATSDFRRSAVPNAIEGDTSSTIQVVTGARARRAARAARPCARWPTASSRRTSSPGW